MSLALTDLLIDVSDPANLRLFRDDPEAFMSGFDLSDEEKNALRTGNSRKLRFFAQSINAGDRSGAYVQFSGFSNPAQVEVDMLVELQTQSNTQDEAFGPELTYIDDDGRLYKGVVEVSDAADAAGGGDA